MADGLLLAVEAGGAKTVGRLAADEGYVVRAALERAGLEGAALMAAALAARR